MRTWIAALIAGALWPAVAPAQTTYPTKPITIVVPASPGGVTDALGRTLAQRFTEAWGQQVIVENKPGANNQIAAEYVTKSAPDGYTLFIGPETTFVVNPSLYPKLPYDPVKGFTPISGLVTINHALIVNPDLPVKNVKELLALDVMAGHIQMMFISVGSAVPQWKADKVKFLAVGAAKRMALLLEIPTVAESGLPGYEAVSWFGLFGPPGMPADVVAKINAEVRKIFSDPEIKKSFLEKQYFESIAGTPEQLANYIKSDEPKWRKVIQDAKVQAE
jgi:tripartite-type tricarboxylate transporter receptor subunit TctC